jgi:exodeoxyribonuclease V alpha subunit
MSERGATSSRNTRGTRRNRSLARDIRGIGFKTADAIATTLGIEKAAMVPVHAGISYALIDAMDEGHCARSATAIDPDRA